LRLAGFAALIKIGDRDEQDARDDEADNAVDAP
jgi:hypothetical protein